MRVNLLNPRNSLLGSLSSGPDLVLAGSLFLHAIPVETRQAAPKQYTDSAFGTLNASKITSGTIPVGRLPSYSGDVIAALGTNVFTLTNTGINPDTYTKVLVDNKGRILSGTIISDTDIPDLDFSKVNLFRPFNLAGYGITNGVSRNGDTLSENMEMLGDIVNSDDASTMDYLNNETISKQGNVPTGFVIIKSSALSVSGFLRCNGGVLNKSLYSALYGVIGDTFSYDYNSIGNGKPWKSQYGLNTQQSGAIGTWSTATSLPGNSALGSVLATKNRVYLIAGSTGSANIESNPNTTVYTAVINSDGTLGTWTTASGIPQDLSGAELVVYKNKAYLIGGFTDSTNTSSNVYSCDIYSDGTIGSWVPVSTLPISLGYCQALMIGNYLFIIGGQSNSSTYLNTVYRAKINEDGSVGVWNLVSTLPTNLSRFSAVLLKNKLYILGGTVSSNSTSRNIYISTIDVNYDLSSWVFYSEIPSNLAEFSLVSTSSTLYLLGGSAMGSITDPDAVFNTYSCTINQDGSLGSWVSGNALALARVGMRVLITSSKIYLLGGHDSDTYNTVQTANFIGGYNDYTPYYTSSITEIDINTEFKLPDYSTLEDDSKKIYYFIKY